MGSANENQNSSITDGQRPVDGGAGALVPGGTPSAGAVSASEADAPAPSAAPLAVGSAFAHPARDAAERFTKSDVGTTARSCNVFCIDSRGLYQPALEQPAQRWLMTHDAERSSISINNTGASGHGLGSVN
jgi:hypothetical protein